MKYNIITEIDGVKQYLRRFRIGKYAIVPTMYCASKSKAFDFGTQEKASKALSQMGIGKAIETND